jgi:hypothetical protein
VTPHPPPFGAAPGSNDSIEEIDQSHYGNLSNRKMATAEGKKIIFWPKEDKYFSDIEIVFSVAKRNQWKPHLFIIIHCFLLSNAMICTLNASLKFR